MLRRTCISASASATLSCKHAHTPGNQRVARMFIGRLRNMGDGRGIRSRRAFVAVGRAHPNHRPARIVLASLTRCAKEQKPDTRPAASRLSQRSRLWASSWRRFTRVGARIRTCERPPCPGRLVVIIPHRPGKTEAATPLRSGAWPRRDLRSSVC
jgi:hypothetical protein